MNLTPRQQDIVDHRGSTLLVSASAGSGKTEVLARRCLALIADRSGPCRVDQLLVVTFTRAAAAELRVRIAGMLHAAAERANDSRLRYHLLRQATLLDGADIDTIDAWCARLVREHFEDAGVDPAFAVLGAEEGTLLEREILDRLFDDLHAGAGDLHKRTRSWVARAARPSDQFLREAVAALHAYRDHLVDPESWHARQALLHGASPDDLRDSARRALAAAIREECDFQFSQLRLLAAELRDERAAPAFQAYGAALVRWKTSLDDPTCVEALGEDIGQFTFPKRPPSLPDADARLWKEVKERWHGRRLCRFGGADAIDAMVRGGPSASELVALLLEIEQRYHEELTVEKRRRAALGFGDIQRLALRILRDPASGAPSAIAHALRQRYEHVLVDEVQDTSPVQFELLRMIARDEPGRSNAFLVGDVKQSIYGFREAEPRLFADRIERANRGASDARALSLADNFRSHAGVLEPLNDVFAILFSAELGGLQYDDAARLQARRGEIANPSLDLDPRVELHIVDSPKAADAASESDDFAGDASGPFQDDTENPENGEPEMPLARIEREAAVAAERIQALKRVAQIPERQSNGEVQLRPIRFGDIVILLRSARGNATLAASALRAAGVPSVAVGRESMLDNLQVADVRNVLALLTNRRQDLAMAAYLRGPLGGLSADDLMEIRMAFPQGPFGDAVLQFAEIGSAADSAQGAVARVRAALTQLETWSRLARSADLPELLRRILHDGALRLFAQALPGGEHRVAMLQALQDYADEFSAAGQSGLAEFVEHLDALDASQLRPGAATAVDDDVVRIMTVHASKGLEFPVVLMMNCGAWFSRRPRGGSLRCDAELGIGLRFLDYPNHREIATVAAPLIDEQIQNRERDEELRLLYVAATRAREKLIFIGHGKSESWSDWTMRFNVPGSKPPLMERLGARSLLDWLMMGFAADGARRVASEVAGQGRQGMVHVQTHVGPFESRENQSDARVLRPGAAAPFTDAERRWIDESVSSLTCNRSFKIQERSAVLAVSALKDQMAEDDAPTHWLPREPHLSIPAFALEVATVDGRDRGTALHRFLEHAEFSRLADEKGVQQEVERLLQSKRILPAEAALLDRAAILWLGSTEPILVAARHGDKCRREVPFVYALPAPHGGDSTIVRGVIDCLVETERGLLLLDYKTDRIRNEEDFSARIGRYETQIRFYALAAASIFGRPAERAHLLFLEPRRIVTVDVLPASLDRLLSELEVAML